MNKSTVYGTLGALAALLLIASEVFVSQAASQYSDLLAGLAFLAVLVLLEAASSTLTPTRLLIAAGLAMGFAPWIKNEGLPFSLAAMAVVVWKFGASASGNRFQQNPGASVFESTISPPSSNTASPL